MVFIRSNFVYVHTILTEPSLPTGESEMNSNNSNFLITRFSHYRRVSKRDFFGQNKYLRILLYACNIVR